MDLNHEMEDGRLRWDPPLALPDLVPRPRLSYILLTSLLIAKWFLSSNEFHA